MKPTGIGRYTLYRDLTVDDDPEFVHIEDIAIRSRLYEWRITPHRHAGMFQTVVLRGGRAAVRIDDTVHQVVAPVAVTLPSGVVHSFDFEPETVGHVVTVSELLLVDARYRRSRALIEPLTRAPAVIDFSDSPDQCERLVSVLDQMEDEFLWPQLGRASMFEWLLRILLMTLRRQIDRQSAPPLEAGSRGATFARLRELIEDHFREHWPVAAYAEALAVSRVQLNRLAQAFAGKSVSDLIRDRLLLEAQRHLIYTSASAAMVAYELGFQDPAYFSRVFKRVTGLTPGAFRQKRRAAMRSDATPDGEPGAVEPTRPD